MTVKGSFLDTPVEYLKGVGPQRAEILKKELAIFTAADLLSHYPFRYEDRSVIRQIGSLAGADVHVQICGKLIPGELIGTGNARRLTAYLRDDTGVIELIWFQGIAWVQKNLKPGERYLVFGKAALYKGKLSMAHPEIEAVGSGFEPKGKGLVPVYPLTETMRKRFLDSRFLGSVTDALIKNPEFSVAETLPESILNRGRFISKKEAVKTVHHPVSDKELAEATRRLKFEELFYLQLRHLQLKTHRNRTLKGPVFEKVGALFHEFYKNHLPFELTDAQKKVLKEIRRDMATGKQMNRLLQGDVGSGKTIVALLSCLIAADNGFQSCMMAPTEILATQHFYSIRELLAGCGIEPVLLTGSTSKKERTGILENLKNGSIKILIGTHALLENDVDFKDLGFVVIDEQHRFGVAQRAKLWQKGQLVPHVLVMTATPIPRTLAMTVYGDLDVSVIDQLPAGRKQIVTVHRNESTRPLIMQFLREQIEVGRQVYVVFPLIEDSVKLELKSLMSGYDMVAEYLPPPKYTYSMVHGKMKPDEKDSEMQRFKNHQTDIMVATTVIEVGVNVPNATVMLIENAERFGLAQLHQLRGRVGRGADQSYCILLTGPKLSAAAKKRMKTMVETTDGFVISQVDMELRGPGDMDGTRQSGLLDLKLADISRDEEILIQARTEAQSLLERDELLMMPENLPVRMELAKIPHRTVWSKIS